MESARPSNRTAPWKTALSVVAVLFIVSIVFRMLIRLLFPIAAVILLYINRDLVGRIVQKIKDLYEKETYLGLLATAGAIFGFMPFIVFLFFRTGYMAFTGTSIKKDGIEDIKYEEIDDDYSLDNIDDRLEKRVQAILRKDREDSL